MNTRKNSDESVEAMIERNSAIAENWERICDDLIAHNSDDVARINRHQFVQHFLAPMLAQDNALLNHNWMLVAGNVFRHIEVTEVDGTVIGELPSLISSVDTQIVDDESKTMNHLTEESKRQAVFSPRAGQLYLEESFRGRNFRSSSILKSMIAWNNIARHCEGEIPFAQVDQALRAALPEPTRTFQDSSHLGLSEDDDEML